MLKLESNEYFPQDPNLYDFSKTKTFLAQNEWKIVLLLSVFCVFAIFWSTGTIFSGYLSKVDFATSFGNESFWSGWSHDNFGKPIGLGKSVIVVQSLVSLFPVFPYKDFIFYYLTPTCLVGLGLFIWVAGHLRERNITNSNLVASYTLLFFFNSIIFLSVFLYGWNLIILLPIAGMAFACRGIDLFYGTETSTGLLYVAFGSFLIGGMVQFLVFPILYAIDPKRGLKKIFLVISVFLLANAYTIVPEIFATTKGFAHYVGVDSVEDSKNIQTSIFFFDRMSGSFDPLIRNSWNHALWVLVLFVGYWGIVKSKSLYLGTPGGYIAFKLFFFLTFSGMFWEISINRIWTLIPAVGGMFRDPNKIFAVFLLPVFFFAALWMRNYRVTRLLVAVCILLSTFQLYFVSELKERTQIARIELPRSYVEIKREIISEERDRVLLLPFPDWFHHYQWAEGIQVANLLSVAISTPTISDEFSRAVNIPIDRFDSINVTYSSHCRNALANAKDLGITQIVLQKDIESIPKETINTYRKSLVSCFGNPTLSSGELDLFKVQGSQGWISIKPLDNERLLQSSIRFTPFGLRICTNMPSSLVVKETNALRSYTILDSSSRTTSSLNASGWAEWQVHRSGCYSLLNLHSLIQIASLLISLGTIGLLCCYLPMKRRKAVSERSLQDEREI